MRENHNKTSLYLSQRGFVILVKKEFNYSHNYDYRNSCFLSYILSSYFNVSRYPCSIITAACLSITFFLFPLLTSASMRIFSAITVVRRSS